MDKIRDLFILLVARARATARLEELRAELPEELFQHAVTRSTEEESPESESVDGSALIATRRRSVVKKVFGVFGLSNPGGPEDGWRSIASARFSPGAAPPMHLAILAVCPALLIGLAIAVGAGHRSSEVERPTVSAASTHRRVTPPRLEGASSWLGAGIIPAVTPPGATSKPLVQPSGEGSRPDVRNHVVRTSDTRRAATSHTRRATRGRPVGAHTRRQRALRSPRDSDLAPVIQSGSYSPVASSAPTPTETIVASR